MGLIPPQYLLLFMSVKLKIFSLSLSYPSVFSPNDGAIFNRAVVERFGIQNELVYSILPSCLEVCDFPQRGQLLHI